MKEKTIQEVFDVCLLEHWGSKKFQLSGYTREVRNNWNRNLKKTFGHLPISRVDITLVRRWHKDLAETPVDANRAKAVLSKLFSFAQTEGWTDRNPCILVPNHHEKMRSRFANDDEIAKIGKILRGKTLSHPREVAFLYLLMYTGSRPRAIERALLSQLEKVQVDGKTFGVLRFEGKTGDEDLIIPPQGLKLVERLPIREDGLLLGKFPREFWNEVRAEAGCPNLWARDWRRTFATLGLSHGISLGQVGEILNHKNHQTTMRYAKLIPTIKARAVMAIGQEMEARLKKKE